LFLHIRFFILAIFVFVLSQPLNCTITFLNFFFNIYRIYETITSYCFNRTTLLPYFWLWTLRTVTSKTKCWLLSSWSLFLCIHNQTIVWVKQTTSFAFFGVFPSKTSKTKCWLLSSWSLFLRIPNPTILWVKQTTSFTFFGVFPSKTQCWLPSSWSLFLCIHNPTIVWVKQTTSFVFLGCFHQKRQKLSVGCSVHGHCFCAFIIQLLYE